MRNWGVSEIAVASLGAALVVFFAGSTAAVAAGANPPTALWGAGGAISGGLLGLLAPAPVPRKVRAKTIEKATGDDDAALKEAQDPSTASGAVMRATSLVAVGSLMVLFVLLLALAIILAGGAITPPASFGTSSMQGVIKVVVALASAAGTGVIGLIAPQPGATTPTRTHASGDHGPETQTPQTGQVPVAVRH